MIMSKIRSRTSSKYIYYALQLYFSGLSLRKTSQRLSQFITRNHVSIWNWIQRYKPKKIFQTRCKLSEFIIDETLIKVGNDYVWLWVAIEPTDRQSLVFASPLKEICLWLNSLYKLECITFSMSVMKYKLELQTKDIVIIKIN